MPAALRDVNETRCLTPSECTSSLVYRFPYIFGSVILHLKHSLEQDKYFPHSQTVICSNSPLHVSEITCILTFSQTETKSSGPFFSASSLLLQHKKDTINNILVILT